MPMFEVMRQKPVQAGRDAVGRGEAPVEARRGKADSPRYVEDVTGLALLEAALTRENPQQAFKQVHANRGSAGVDGLDIDQTAHKLTTEWPVIREWLLRGRIGLGGRSQAAVFLICLTPAANLHASLCKASSRARCTLFYVELAPPNQLGNPPALPGETY